MSCKPCAEKRAAAEAAAAATAIEQHPEKPTFLAIKCFCGLTRILPTELHYGDSFELVPCPKCGSAFRGRIDADGVHELVD